MKVRPAYVTWSRLMASGITSYPSVYTTHLSLRQSPALSHLSVGSPIAGSIHLSLRSSPAPGCTSLHSLALVLPVRPPASWQATHAFVLWTHVQVHASMGMHARMPMNVHMRVHSLRVPSSRDVCMSGRTLWLVPVHVPVPFCAGMSVHLRPAPLCARLCVRVHPCSCPHRDLCTPLCVRAPSLSNTHAHAGTWNRS